MVAWGLWAWQVSGESSSAESGATDSCVWKDKVWSETEELDWSWSLFFLPSVSPHLILFFETAYDSVRECCFKKMAGKSHFDRLRVTDGSTFVNIYLNSNLVKFIKCQVNLVPTSIIYLALQRGPFSKTVNNWEHYRTNTSLRICAHTALLKVHPLSALSLRVIWSAMIRSWSLIFFPNLVKKIQMGGSS